jgi:hypothetical protein
LILAVTKNVDYTRNNELASDSDSHDSDLTDSADPSIDDAIPEEGEELSDDNDMFGHQDWADLFREVCYLVI